MQCIKCGEKGLPLPALFETQAEIDEFTAKTKNGTIPVELVSLQYVNIEFRNKFTSRLFKH